MAYNKSILTFILCSIFFCACTQEKSTVEAPVKNSISNTVTLSAEGAKLAGIECIIIGNKTDSQRIETTGQIKADENKVFHINSIVAGRVIKDNVSLGDTIKQGQVLATIQNMEVAKIYGDYIHQAHENEIALKQAQAKSDLVARNLERVSKLYKEGISAEKDVLTAKNQEKLSEIEIGGLKEHAIHIKTEAQSMLSAYGVDIGDTDMHKIKTDNPLVSPRAGVVIQKNITLGDVVNPAQALYIVADLSQVWLDITVYDKDLTAVHEGDTTEFHSDSLPLQTFKGIISYIQPAAGDTTRTFSARAVLPNPGFVLKPGMFGQVLISCKKSQALPYLPDSAIQKIGSQEYVFIDKGDNVYEKREVKLGARSGDGYLITSGIANDERVVSKGSFNLKAEFLKEQTKGGEAD